MIMERTKVSNFRLVYCAPTTGGVRLVKDLIASNAMAVHTSWIGVEEARASATSRKVKHESSPDCLCSECSAGRMMNYWLSTHSDAVVVTDVISDKVLRQIDSRHLLNGSCPVSIVRPSADLYSAAAHAEGRSITSQRAAMWHRANDRVREVSHVTLDVGFRSKDPVVDPVPRDLYWADDALEFGYDWLVKRIELERLVEDVRVRIPLGRRTRRMYWFRIDEGGSGDPTWLMLKQGNGDGTGNEAMVYRGTIEEYRQGYPHWGDFNVGFRKLDVSGKVRFWWKDGNSVFVVNLKGTNLAFETTRSVPAWAVDRSSQTAPPFILVDPVFPID